VCGLVNGIEKYCPNSMTKLRICDYMTYRCLFSTDATAWSKLTHVEIGLWSSMENAQPPDLRQNLSRRTMQSTDTRWEEEAFDNKSFDLCKRDHQHLGNDFLRGIYGSFENVLQSLWMTSKNFPGIVIRPISSLKDMPLHPFDLGHPRQSRKRCRKCSNG
jgi:hypothetical protein